MKQITLNNYIIEMRSIGKGLYGTVYRDYDKTK